MLDDNKIGDLLKQRRKLLKISQFDLALELGFSPKVISNLENGKGSINLHTLSLYCQYIGLDVIDLLEMSRLSKDLLLQSFAKNVIQDIDNYEYSGISSALKLLENSKAKDSPYYNNFKNYLLCVDYNMNHKMHSFIIDNKSDLIGIKSMNNLKYKELNLFQRKSILSLANAYFLSDDYDSSIKTLLDLTSIEIKSDLKLKILLNLSHSLYKNGDFKKSLTFLEEADILARAKNYHNKLFSISIIKANNKLKLGLDPRQDSLEYLFMLRLFNKNLYQYSLNHFEFEKYGIDKSLFYSDL